jgi:nucleotide-binding universal stress UspA family protein
MASHGWRGFDRLLLGSETHKVILNGDVPVLVCR